MFHFTRTMLYRINKHTIDCNLYLQSTIYYNFHFTLAMQTLKSIDKQDEFPEKQADYISGVDYNNNNNIDYQLHDEYATFSYEKNCHKMSKLL